MNKEDYMDILLAMSARLSFIEKTMRVVLHSLQHADPSIGYDVNQSAHKEIEQWREILQGQSHDLSTIEQAIQKSRNNVLGIK